MKIILEPQDIQNTPMVELEQRLKTFELNNCAVVMEFDTRGTHIIVTLPHGFH
jgi:hypothetical protein